VDAVGAILASAVFMMRDFTIIDLAAAPFLPSTRPLRILDEEK